jgi:formamidopyrimidine-DNA glycosylase
MLEGSPVPELPEVEIVRRGLAAVMEGARFTAVETRRPDLRFPLPQGFVRRLVGARVERLDRRGKYLVATLSTGEALIMHLGMSGRFTVRGKGDRRPGASAPDVDPRHDHILFDMKGRAAVSRISYNDPRRFGFMDLAPASSIDACKHFAGMGPEPLSPAFTAGALNAALSKRAAPVKAALLDQGVVAGVGNIYACEALFRARISPKRSGRSVAGARGARLYSALKEVLAEAIDAGGSSLKDFAASDGELGYFQHRFRVYDREGKPCLACANPVRRLIQSGRSTFFCPACQR